MESETSFDLDNLVFTPGDPGFPFPSPSSDLPPVQPSHMESEPSLEVQNSASTGPTDVGFPFLAPSSDLPPVQPSNLSIGRLRPEVAAALPSWKSPDLSSTHTDQELVENYLSPVVRPSGFPEESLKEIMSRCRDTPMDVATNPAVVNAGLPSMNPSELPGIMAGKQGMRQKYYLTDHYGLCFISSKDKTETPNGFWKSQEGLGCLVGLSISPFAIAGYKKTYIWNDMDGVKSNWVMNVYMNVYNGTEDGIGFIIIDSDLVLCHVFEAPPDYNAKPKCPSFDQGGCRCRGIHRHEGINSPTNTSFNSIPRGSSPMHRGPHRRHDPSYMENLESILFGDPDPDPDSCMETEKCSPTRGVSPTDDHGQSNKRRKKSSDVWDYFTKIYACDLEGNVVTLAACNHCSKVLTGSSKGGTTHLARHACPCKFKPVQVARMDKGVVSAGGS